MGAGPPCGAEGSPARLCCFGEGQSVDARSPGFCFLVCACHRNSGLAQSLSDHSCQRLFCLRLGDRILRREVSSHPLRCSLDDMQDYRVELVVGYPCRLAL